MTFTREYLPPEVKKVQPRSRLYGFMEEKSVIIVTGSPGQGKSTAVSDFIKSEEKKCVWYKLEEKDRNHEHFLENLEKFILIYTDGLFQKPGIKKYQGKEPAEAALEFADSVKGKIPGDLYIIFDNFQAVNSSRHTCRVTEVILDKLSAVAKIIIISRETPQLSLAKIRTRKELTELKNIDLEFNREDLHELLYNIYDMSLDSIIVDRLLDITGGWITGIIFLMERLSCLNRKDGELLLEKFFTEKGIPEIDDYFQNEVIRDLPADTIEVLKKLGSTDYFSPDLTEIISGKSGIKLINDLVRDNLFTRVVDSASYTFTFNPLFKQFLSKEFRRLSPETKNGVLSAIAEFYAEEENTGKAVKYLCEAGQYEKAKEHLVRHAEILIKNNEYEAINDMLKAFPEEMLENDPYISFYEAVSSNLVHPDSSRKKLLKLLYIFKGTGDLDKEAAIYSVLLTNYFFYQTNARTVARIISMAEEFLETAGKRVDDEGFELLKALIPLGQWWTGEAREKAFEVALRAEEMSSRIRNEEAFLCSRLVLSKIYMARGEFNQAKRLLTKTEKLFDDANYSLYKHYQCLASFYTGDTYFYCGEISTAIAQIYKALNNSSRDFAFRPYLNINLIYYNLYQKNIDKAEELYRSMYETETGENLYLQYNILYLFEMLIAYRNRNKHRAEYYCHRLQEKENEKLLLTDFPYSHFALAEVTLYVEGPKASRHILEKLTDIITAEEYPYPYASSKALLGYLAYIEGDKKNAEKLFSEAEKIITEKGYVNIDICSPDLLKEIAVVSRLKIFDSFPRLKHEAQADVLENANYDLEISTLGNFRVFVRGKEISADLLGGQKRVMDLLKLLIIYRKNGVMKERIYELFWPRYSYKSARDNLNTIIYRLRKLLNDKNDFLSTDVNSIRFKENSVITDVDRFFEYYELGADAEKSGNFETALSMYNSAVKLYKGDFLESDLYYDFIRDERENLKGKYRSLLFRMTRISFETANYREALEWAKKLIEADPLCEPAYRLLMVASAAVGNRSEIPRLYSKLNGKLQTYYKVSADDLTTKLKDRLLSGAPPDSSMWKNETII